MNINSVCAVIVVFYSDRGFEERLDMLLSQLDLLVIVDNSSNGIVSSVLKERCNTSSKLVLIQNFLNVGVSKALNQGLEVAEQFGCKWLLTLDQDTICYNDIVMKLIKISNEADSDIKVIGGNYYDSHNQRLHLKIENNKSYQEVKTVITSGCLIDVNVSLEVGGFKEEYFIDQVDREFCLRIRANGYKVIITAQAVMEHCVGDKGGANIPFIGVLPNHSPVRKYYISRNTIITILNNWKLEPLWCLNRLIKLLLGFILIVFFEKDKLLKVKAFIIGVVDAFRNRIGACKYEWLKNDMTEIIE